MGTPPASLSRRQFLGRLAVAGGGAVAAACQKPTSGEAKGPAGQSLTAEELRLCRAACDRILPADADPGAVQLGAVDYIDRKLAGSSRRVLQARRKFRKGLAQLAAWSLDRNGESFWRLDADTQDVTLASLAAEGGDDGYDFVRQLTILTLEGAFSDPSHGGNRHGEGWKLLGFSPQSSRSG